MIVTHSCYPNDFTDPDCNLLGKKMLKKRCQASLVMKAMCDGEDEICKALRFSSKVFVDAVKNGGPREDSTRIGSAGPNRK